MEKIKIKLLELEQRRDDIEKYQKELREQMVILDNNEYLDKRTIYYKNKNELDEINNKIQILNNALDIIEGIGV